MPSNTKHALANVVGRDDLHSLVRPMARSYVTQSVSHKAADEYIAEGWEIERVGKHKVRVRKAKDADIALRDRVWSLMYRIGFTYLSTDQGAMLAIDPKASGSTQENISILVMDNETLIAAECLASSHLFKADRLHEVVSHMSGWRPRLSQAARQQFPTGQKRQIALAVFTNNTIVTPTDRQKAQDAGVILFDERDLLYFETLATHLGQAVRYQLLADLFQGKAVPGLELTVPAIQTKVGSYTYYMFSVSPEYLLKIAYVSHRAKGEASDIDTYQRMISGPRLKKIRDYISKNGIFPTNIVISLEKAPRFDRAEQEDGQEDGNVMGWLNLKSGYRSAWVIDGQHRLFAYSDHQRASKARLSVLAFENLAPSKQAQLFIDINHEQKTVSKSLLVELYARLHENSRVASVRVRAIITKAIQLLDTDSASPFFGRILSADGKADAIRCISLRSMYDALQNSNLYFPRHKEKEDMAPGPLWSADDNEATLRRTVHVLASWFQIIADMVPDWWQAGKNPGGGLAMNDGVTACIMVLRSVFDHLASKGISLAELSNVDLIEMARPFGVALGIYLASLTEEERVRFRGLRGNQGQRTAMRWCQSGIQEQIADFDPPGLSEYKETEKAQTNAQAQALIHRIETTLKSVVIGTLKARFGEDEKQWWVQGVPVKIRVPVTKLYEEDNAQRGGKEDYLNLIEYRDIVLQHWALFGPVLGYGKANESKDKRTAWIREVNDIRRIWAHASSGQHVSFEQLETLRRYDRWLATKTGGTEGENSGVEERDSSSAILVLAERQSYDPAARE